MRYAKTVAASWRRGGQLTTRSHAFYPTLASLKRHSYANADSGGVTHGRLALQIVLLSIK